MTQEDDFKYTIGKIEQLSNSNFNPFLEETKRIDKNTYTLKMPDGVTFVKTHPDAQIPTSKHLGDTGYDVYSVEDTIVPARGKKVVNVGLEFAHIPYGYWIRVESRSGLSFKHSIETFNGIIDGGYRGSANILLYNHGTDDYHVKKGDRIAQFVIYPLIKIDMAFSEDKTESHRGDSGIGSTGR